MKEKGVKVPTTAHIASALGVSKMAVSLALRGRGGVSERLRSEVLREAERIGYRRDAALCRAMSFVKTRRRGAFCETIALLNANKNPRAFYEHPTLPEFVRGIERGAKRLGYGVDRFWLYENGMGPERLAKIFRSRGIRGGIIAGIYDDAVLPSEFAPIWRDFKFVAAGFRTSNPPLDYAAADQFLIARNAVLEALKRGYSRPALVLDRAIDNVVDGRFSGGFLRAQLELKASDRIPPFLHGHDDPSVPGLFKKWFMKVRPDVILCLYNSPKKWLESLGARVPEDVALVQLERRRGMPEWSGMNQHNDIVGELAVVRLSDFLKSSDCGYLTATLVAPDWIDSGTMLKRR